MKSRKHASPGKVLGNVYFFDFVFFVFCFCIFQVFYAKKNHIILLQSEKDIFVQERKNTAKDK